MLFTFWQTLLDRIEHLEKLCDKKEKFLQVSTSRRGGRGGGDYLYPLPYLSSPPPIPPSLFSQPR